jgi:hypothetical protein
MVASPGLEPSLRGVELVEAEEYFPLRESDVTAPYVEVYFPRSYLRRHPGSTPEQLLGAVRDSLFELPRNWSRFRTNLKSPRERDADLMRRLESLREDISSPGYVIEPRVRMISSGMILEAYWTDPNYDPDD